VAAAQGGTTVVKTCRPIRKTRNSFFECLHKKINSQLNSGQGIPPIMTQIEIDKDGKQFLIKLFEHIRGKSDVQVSMYDIGAELGMDRDASSRITEDLMALGLVEIRSLSGGIAITENGIDESRKLGTGGEFESGSKLGDAPVIDDSVRESVESVTAKLKAGSGDLKLSFDILTEFMADLKTIDAQMMSSRPKTAIIRACFTSVKDVMEKAKAGELLSIVNSLLKK
jgi:hypothetical protein